MDNRVLKLLQNWDKYSESDYFLCPGTELITYGTGYGGWAVQTNQKALAAIAVLGVKTNDKSAIEKAIKMLRFSLRTHIEGDIVCLDGKKWGHTWISILGIERMMHAVYLLIPYMTDEDKDLMKKVFVSECEWICDNHPVHASIDAATGHNAPESNMWNGAFLYRVAKMYPDTPRAKDFITKGESFMLNALSIESDIGKEGVIGANYTNSFALNHHRYLNVGYMVITLSQVAMLHFYCKEFGIEPPKNLYNNVEGSWKLVKSCTAPDGRLIRIGGDTRVRYCYCQDYAVPMWLFIKDYLHDKDCDTFLDGWVKQVEKEVEFNGDGSFLSDRCGNLKTPSPIYYTRLESDRAAALSMIPAWKTDKAEKEIETHKIWHDNFHGASMIQNDDALISWVWGYTHGGPVGVCVPKSDSTFAEWEWNLAGSVKGIGLVHEYIVSEHKEQMLDGGFVSIGKGKITGLTFLAEQQTEDNLAEISIAFSALPDGKTALILQKADLYENSRTYIQSVRGINLSIPNDLFNGCKRTYVYDGGKLEKKINEKGLLSAGKWINADDKLGVSLVYGKEDLKLVSPKSRETKINKVTTIDTGNLYCDVITCEYSDTPSAYYGAETLIDCGFAVICGNTEQTKSASVSGKTVITADNTENLRYAEVNGTDGNRYLLLANFGNEPVSFTTSGKLTDINTKAVSSGGVAESMSAYLYIVK